MLCEQLDVVVVYKVRVGWWNTPGVPARHAVVTRLGKAERVRRLGHLDSTNIKRVVIVANVFVDHAILATNQLNVGVNLHVGIGVNVSETYQSAIILFVGLIDRITLQRIHLVHVVIVIKGRSSRTLARGVVGS